MTVRALVAAVAVTGWAAGAGVAEAGKPFETVRYHNEFDFVTDRCALAVRIAGSEDGNVVGRPTGEQGLARYTLTWRGTSTWTNIATGKHFTFVWKVAQQDVAVVDNGDGTLTLLFQNAGPEKIYGPDGQRLFIAVGIFRERVLLDHGETPADPSDDTFISSEIVFATPGLPDPSSDFCTTFRTLTGSTALP